MEIANALLGLATRPSSQRSLLAGRQHHGAAGLVRHERRALSQRDHAPERPSGGVVNAPAWAGFTTLHLEAPLSAALANGEDTLSITADCNSVAAADAALAAALLVVRKGSL